MTINRNQTGRASHYFAARKRGQGAARRGMITGATTRPQPRSRDRAGIAPEKIERRRVESLRAAPTNLRTHSRRQIRQIADSIRSFGFTTPILIDESDGVIAGHGRVAAAKLLGLEEVPVIRLSHMSVAEKRAYIIADNRLAELAGWDNELLALELSELSSLDLDFDLSVTGFATAEIDLLIASVQSPDPAADLIPPLEPEKPPVSRPVAARPTSSTLRRCQRCRRDGPPDGWRPGADGLHRPALQSLD